MYWFEYAIHRISLAILRKVCCQYHKKNIEYFVLPNSEEQDVVTYLRQDDGSAFWERGASGAVEDVAEPVPSFDDDDNWKLKDAVGFEEVKVIMLKRRLYGMYGSSRAKRGEVFETVSEAFKLVKECLLVKGPADSLKESNAQARRL